MHDPSSSNLRRALLSGYRVEDVDVLLAQFSLRLSQLWDEHQALKRRFDESERERASLEQRLEEARDRERELLGTVTKLHEVRSEREREAEGAAQQIVDAANLEAARIRAEAAKDTDRLRLQVDELLRLRDTLASTMRAVTRDFDRVMTTAPESPAPQRLRPIPSPPPVAAPTPPAPRGSLFDGRVQVEAGPFEDFASLAAFERALGRLPKVEDVYIRRFEGDRATIDVTLEEPATLLDSMTAEMPYQLSVDHAAEDRIALNVSAG